MELDATAPVPDPDPGSFVGGTSVAPDGQTVGVNSRHLLLNGRPWLPVMGEFHYSRCPDKNWEEEILKMKAGGVQVVATYVFWIHHEEVEGQFDWTGRRDLRRFVTLCARHGMYVQLRIGPWDHGEVRSGGFPDWLLKRVPAAGLPKMTSLVSGMSRPALSASPLWSTTVKTVRALSWRSRVNRLTVSSTE